MTASQFVTDAEINQYINDSASDLYDQVLSTDTDYYLSPTPFQISTVAGQDTYALPADFYKIKGVEAQLSASQQTWVTLQPFNWQQRNLYNWVPVAWNILGIGNVKYHVIGSASGVVQIKFIPLPNMGNNLVRLWYIPVSPALVLDTDTLDGVDGWDEYVVVDAAIKCKQKEESDVAVLMARKAELKDRIMASAGPRDVEAAPVSQDRYTTNAFPFPDDGF